MTHLERNSRGSILALLLSPLVACDSASTGSSSNEPGPAQAAGIDPSLVLASRGGGTHPAAGTTAILGRGFDSLQGEVLGDCVEKAKAVSFAGDDGQGGATSNLEVRYARTREELASALGVSAEASASFGFFSGSVRAQYAHQEQIASDTTFLVISNEIVNDTESLETYRLSEGAEKVLRDGGPKAFYQMCGDQFIAARVTGGSLHVVIEIRKASRSFEDQMSAGADIGAWVFSASGEISTKAKQVLGTEESRQRVFQAGGHSRPESLEELVPYAYRFREYVTGKNASAAAPISFVTAPYSVVASASQINIPSLTQQRRKLNDLAVWHGEANARHRALVEAQDARGTCKNKETRFADAVDDVEGLIRAYEVDAQTCVDEPMRGCGVGKARRMSRALHMNLIQECTGTSAVDQRALADKREAAKREAELAAKLREANKGDTDGSPCALWEVRAVKPRLGNAAAWVLVSATANAGGSLQAKEERKLFEESGWAINPTLRLPTGAQLVVDGKVNYTTGCGLFDGPCLMKDKVVSSHAMKLGQTIPNGTVNADQFTLQFECIEAAAGGAGRRVAPRPRPTARTMPPPPQK